MDLNRAIIVGRVTNDPEKRALPSGQSVASFSVATNRVWYDNEHNKKEEAQFHNIIAFGKLADVVSQYLQKGATVLIEGRIQYRSWDGKDGQKHYRTEILTENLQLGPRPGGAGASQSKSPSPSPKKEPQEKEKEIPTVSADEDIDIEEEIPF